MATAGASQEIEQTLRLARDQVEVQIARYRVWVFGAVTLLTLLSQLLQRSRYQVTWIPSLYFATCTLYAIAVRPLVRRLGARTWLVFTLLIFDLSVMTGEFWIPHFIVGPADSLVILFATHVGAPGLLLVLFVNALRNHKLAAIVGAGAGSVLVLMLLIPIEGFQPPQIPLALGFWVVGAVGFAAAEQARKTLDTYARFQLLRRYLSPSAVERVLRDNPDAAMALGGRLVTVTLLSADLRDFTAMSERLTPDEVVEQLNAYHGTMLEQVEAHGGALDKFIGDGTLVVFGLDAASSGDCGALQAVECGRDMLKALIALNLAREQAGRIPLRMGIGIHTGPVVAGNIGAPGRLEFTVIGDAVNTASRLEGLTKLAGTPLLVSANTAERLPDPGGLRELPPMQAKGKEEPLRVFALAA